jgi:hypothetical protein
MEVEKTVILTTQYFQWRKICKCKKNKDSIGISLKVIESVDGIDLTTHHEKTVH